MNNEVLEQLRQEYNETFKRMQDLGEIIANCEDVDTSHCGQDADMDDACCQARNYNQPEGYTYKDLLGMEVIGIGPMASTCAHCSDNVDCVKVELVGGTYMCLAKPQQQESTTEIDDSPKSFEEVYRDSMNLLREFCIKQSEANQRLVEALKEESEELKKPVISFDEEEEKSLGDIMAEIKEKTDNFMDYLDKVVINPQEQ